MNRAFWIAATTSLGLTGTALAQLGEPGVIFSQAQPVPDTPAVVSGEDVADGVFVRDSAVAVDQFALATRLESLGDWNKAADVYQEVVQRYGDRLIADRTGADGRVYQYAAVTRAVQRKLAAWPEEGRRVYEQKFGPFAQGLLDQALRSKPADAGQLQEIVRLYFITETARDAALQLIDQHLVAGRFAAARRLGEELLQTHPALGEHRPGILLRTIIASHFLGDTEHARKLSGQLHEQFPQAVATVAGDERVLAEVAEQVLAESPPMPAQGPGRQWPMFAGAQDRSRVAEPLSSRIAPYIGVELSEEIPARREASQQLTSRTLYNRARESGQMTGIFPAAYDGVLYWSDNLHIYAVGLESGLPVPEWLTTHGDAEGRWRLSGGGYTTPPGVAHAPSVTDRYVLANVGQNYPRLWENVGRPSIASPQLVCLDRQTGRQVWTRQPSELQPVGLDDEALRADFAETRFVGSPLPVGQSVWSLAKTSPQEDRQFEQSFLVQLDVDTGEARSVTYLASASRDAARPVRVTLDAGEADSLLAYADGLIYAPTDAGALAAVRASDGSIEWLNLYPRNDATMIRGRFGSRLRPQSTPNQPFHVNPVVVHAGRIFFKPPDASHLFIYDAANGTEEARIAQDDLADNGGRTLLGVVGPRLVTFGSSAIDCVDWERIVEGASVEEARLWISEIPGVGGRGDAIMGRPALTGDQVLAPGAGSLHHIALDGGRIVDTYPAGDSRWADKEEPGNVVVLDDQVVVAGPTRVNVYADSAAIRRKLEQRLAEAPNDPTPLLRLAQIAFVRGEFDDAEQRLRQADTLADAMRSDPEEARRVKASTFATALGFAQTLIDRLDDALAPGRPTAQTVDRFFNLAEKFARSAPQNVQVRFARADFAATSGGPSRRVELLQEILSEPAWRGVAVSPERADRDHEEDASTPRQAAEVARMLIEQIIEQQGPAVYAAIEQRAAEELTAARTDGDVTALRRVADTYPNSNSAGAALRELAGLLQEQGRVDEAVAVLRRLAREGDDPLDEWLTLVEIDLQREGRFDEAAARLRKAARLAPDRPVPELHTPETRALAGLSLEQAAFALTEQALARDAAQVPDFALAQDVTQPPFAKEATVVNDVERLLTPADGFERHNRVVLLREDGQVAVHAFGQAEPLWTAPLPDKAVEHAAWLPDGLLVWGEQSVALFDPQQGQKRWSYDANALLNAQGGWTPEPLSVVASGWEPADQDPVDANPEAGEGVADGPALERARILEEIRQAQNAQGNVRVQRVQVQGEVRVVINGQLVEQVAVQPGQPRPRPTAGRTGPHIADVAPTPSTVAIVASSTGGEAGRNVVIGLDAENGAVRWTAPLPEGEVQNIRAGGDFVGVETSTQSRTSLSILDLDSGEVATRRNLDSAGANGLVNYLVTPGNELVYVTPQRVVGVDLDLEPAGTRFELQPAQMQSSNSTPFIVAGGEGRLESVGDKLLVYADPRLAGRRDVLVVDMATGRPERFRDESSGETLDLLLVGGETDPEDIRDPDRLPPRMRQQLEMRRQRQRRDARAAMQDPAASPGERMWTSGTSVYLTGVRGLTAYDLTVPGRHWRRLNSAEIRQLDPAVNLAVAIGQNDLLLFDSPQSASGRRVEQPTVRVTAFSRERLDDGRETGLPHHQVELRQGEYELDAAPADWQPAEGGVAILSEGGRLVFLRGAGAE